MNLFGLAWRNVASHPVRSLLTVLAVLVAMFLFCVLRSILTSLDAAVAASSSNRMVVQSAVSLFQILPRDYRQRLEAIDGVESVCPLSWFGGHYRDESGMFAQFACDAPTLLHQYPELVLPPSEREDFLKDRRGAIVGRVLSEKYDWHAGDDVPILPTIYPRVDGGAWVFRVDGVYRSTKENVDENTFYFHHEYLHEMLDRGECHGPKGTGVFLVRVARGHTGAEVGRRIDAFFDGGPQRTRTQTEAAFHTDFIRMLGNLPVFLGMIVGAILFAIVFGVVNTMTIAARTRTRTTGLLKAFGFPDAVAAGLYYLEACLLTGAGTAGGIVLALLSRDFFQRMLGWQVHVYAVAPDTVVEALLLGIGIALLAGGIPAFRARRLSIVDALREEA